jgi:hypothetical protein
LNISIQDLIALATVLLPVLISLSAGLYKHIVDSLPSAQRQAVVDTVRIATQAIAADPTIAADAETASTLILKELHLPASPNLVKSLVALFQQDVPAPSNGIESDQSSSAEAQSVGFAAPVHPVTPANPGL